MGSTCSSAFTWDLENSGNWDACVYQFEESQCLCSLAVGETVPTRRQLHLRPKHCRRTPTAAPTPRAPSWDSSVAQAAQFCTGSHSPTTTLTITYRGPDSFAYVGGTRNGIDTLSWTGAGT